MLLRLLGFVAVAVVALTPAHAEWHEASTDHFVIYADQKQEQVQRFAERLERYHSAMQYLLKRDRAKPSPSNRVTVYVVSNEAQVRKLQGGDNRFVAGFYIPRAQGTLAIVPKVQAGVSEFDLSGERVLLHEYAHHVMYGNSAYSYPLWFSEGFAEFYGAASFEKDGGVGLGQPALNRLIELIQAKNVPIELLLDTKAYRTNKGDKKGYDEFYGRSWLLFHYLSFSKERTGQMSTFLKHLGEGKSEIEAARSSFGDLKKLDKELESYAKSKKMSYWKLKPEALKIGTIGVRQLDQGEAAIMPVRIRSRRGVDEASAKEVVSLARAVAAKYPQNAAVLDALSEAEFDAGNDDAAIKAADAATAINPKSINAMLQKGYAMARKAETAAEPKKAWAAVRSQFLKANAIENDHPIPLIHYYRSYVDSGSEPTKNALDGLVWAMELAPFDKELRLNTASALIGKERYDEAIMALKPIINEAHDEAIGKMAQELTAKAEEAKAEAVKKK